MANVIDLSAHRASRKTVVSNACAAPRRAIAWGEVLRAIPSDDARAWALDPYRAGGFTADDFATRRKARERMADCLTKCEDRLEMARRKVERAAIREVRRALELELWP